MKLSDLTPDWLREVWLWKIPTSFDNDSLGDDAFQFYLDSAISYTSNLINVDISRARYKEVYDFKVEEWIRGFGYLQLNHRPATKIHSLKFNLLNSVIEIPNEWIKLKQKTAQVQLLPYYGALLTGRVAGLYTIYAPLLMGSDYLPQVLECDYEAGFSDDLELDTMIANYIGMKASIGIMNVLGEIALGGQAALSSYSIGIDGLSQSVNTTASAENHAYSARIRMYEKEMDGLEKLLKQKYYGLRVVAI